MNNNALEVVRNLSEVNLHDSKYYDDFLGEFCTSSHNAAHHNQYMMDLIRARWIYRGFPLREAGTSVTTLFPNILSELSFSGTHIANPPKYAQLSNEIFAAVLEDGEGLTDWEIERIAGLFRVKPWYIQQNSLFMVEPCSDEFPKLRSGLEELAQYPEYHLADYDKDLCILCYLVLAAGHPVPWAAYHNAERAVKFELWRCRERRNQPKKRTVSISMTMGANV